MSENMVKGLVRLGYNLRQTKKGIIILEGDYERKDVVIGGKYRFRYSQTRDIWVYS